MTAPCTADLTALLEDYVLGDLASGEVARVDAHLSTGCGRCSAELFELTAVEETLQSLAPPVPASRRARERVLAMAAQVPDATLPVSIPHAASDGQWTEICPGVARRDFSAGPGAPSRAYLVRIAAGATVPRHDHGVAEHCFVVAGACLVTGDGWEGERALSVGDYHRADVGCSHAFFSEGGCDILVVEATAPV